MRTWGIGTLPKNGEMLKRDLKGENVFYLPDEAPIVVGAKEALTKIGILS